MVSYKHFLNSQKISSASCSASRKKQTRWLPWAPSWPTERGAATRIRTASVSAESAS